MSCWERESLKPQSNWALYSWGGSVKWAASSERVGSEIFCQGRSWAWRAVAMETERRRGSAIFMRSAFLFGVIWVGDIEKSGGADVPCEVSFV